MSSDPMNTISSRVADASQEACRRWNLPAVDRDRLEDALSASIDPQRLIDNLAEAWRISTDDARALLEERGFGNILARLGPQTSRQNVEEVSGPPLSPVPVFTCAEGGVTVRAINPTFDKAVQAPQNALDSVTASLAAFLPNAESDALGVLYRRDPAAYAKRWLAETAPEIDSFIRTHFGQTAPRYLVNSGIGANEQFNYFVSSLANARPDRPLMWLLANSPKEIATLPADVSVENTLFMEFSRSGITEETVKLHELTPRTAKRIVFSNAGPLRSLGRRDGNLVLPLPDEVSGRYGRNKTPILMAPMYVAGLDVADYWQDIETACRSFDLGNKASLPVVLASYLRLQQLRHGVNHIYLGTNDLSLRYAADEFAQFWNEGVNRDGNDITMSRYLGLPRDSHMNLEAILGTSERKMAVFLVRMGPVKEHPMLLGRTDPLEADHQGLSPGDVDLILTLANAQRCSEKMPTVLIAVNRIDLTTSAWLGQLWADTTLVYARMIGMDPGSNPEVKAVRTRAAGWLADKKRAFQLIGDGERTSV